MLIKVIYLTLEQSQLEAKVNTNLYEEGIIYCTIYDKCKGDFLYQHLQIIYKLIKKRKSELHLTYKPICYLNIFIRCIVYRRTFLPDLMFLTYIIRKNSALIQTKISAGLNRLLMVSFMSSSASVENLMSLTSIIT